jgi:hypothetical protein
MGILSMFKFKKAPYAINEIAIKKHAKLVFKSLIRFYSDIKYITASQGLPSFHKDISRSIEDDLGVGPNSKYSESIINNDNFKILVIYHIGLSNVLKYKPSFATYNFYKQMIDKILEDNKNVNSISNDSTMIKSFSVDPAALPVSYKQFISSIDEFTMATSMIVKKLKILKTSDKYMTYEEYFSYLNDEIKKLIIELHDKGFYNTHELERFTALSLSYICRFPQMDTLYKRPENDRIITNGVQEVSTKTICSIQKNLFDLLSGLGGLKYGDENGTNFD